MQTLTAFFIAFLGAFLSTPLFREIARRGKILDTPARRKVHSQPTPLLGGLGIYAGIITAFFLFPDNLRLIRPVLAGASVILAMGVIDDARTLPAAVRLFIQIITAAAVVASGVRVSFMPSGFWGDAAEFIITVIWFVGVTNAFNYLDGLDGLAAGSAALNFLGFFIILYATGQFAAGLTAAIFMGACLGFLPHNFSRKRKIFLGDAGSTFLGFTLAGIAVRGHWASDNIVKLFIPVLILGVPIFDMIFTTFMRVREEKVKSVLEWLKYGGRDHFHHYLVDIGLSRKGAVLFIYYLTFSLGLGAFMLSNDTALEALLTLLQTSIVFGVIGVLIVVGKKRKSGWSRHE